MKKQSKRKTPSASLREMALAGRPLWETGIVDIHVHLGQWGTMHLPVTDDEMLAKMDRAGVRWICVNAILQPDTRAGNDAVAAFVRRHPGRAVGFAALNPYQHDVEDELKRCALELGLRGIKLHEVVARVNGQRPLASPRQATEKWDKVWRLAAAQRLPVLYHGIVTEDDIRKHPATVFIHAHGFCGLKGEAVKRRMARFPNVYLDTAYTQNTVWEAEESVRIFGPTRIVWGTDAPLDDFAQRFGIILDLPIGDAEKGAILGGNARRLLGLNVDKTDGKPRER
jgi:predicted TIM-barrel fold metal-dependent hydrolase